MFHIAINEADVTPIYKQIVDKVRSEIAAGRLKPSEKLPSVRQLAELLKVNVNTVHKAYGILQQMKLVVVRRARGVIVDPGIAQTLGSQGHEKLLAQHVRELLDEASRLGFSGQDVVELIGKLQKTKG